MRITSEGQITIPVEIREKLGFFPETEVEFEIIGEVLYLHKTGAVQSRGKTLIAMMRGKAAVNLSTDEIMALTRSE